MILTKEKLHTFSKYIIIDDDMTPTRNHQIHDELMDMEKEFGAMLYYQKDMEGRYL
jgi:hypothetical protein